MTGPTHSYRTFVACDVADAWDALVNGEQTARYYYGTRVESDWTEAGPIRYLSPDGSVVADGVVLSVEPPNRLELMFHARWDPDLENEGPVRMVWLVEEANGISQITVESYLDPASTTYEHWSSGIPFIVSGLKTLLETGKPLGSS